MCVPAPVSFYRYSTLGPVRACVLSVVEIWYTPVPVQYQYLATGKVLGTFALGPHVVHAGVVSYD